MQRPEFFFVALGLFVSMINGAILPCFGVIFGQVTGVFAKPTEEMLQGAALWSGVFTGLMGLNFIINLLQTGCFGVTGERLTRRIRELSFRAMLRQDVKFFDDRMNGTGVLTARLSEDADRIQLLTGPITGNLIQLAVSMSVAVGLAFYYSWQMTLIVLVSC
jgi:ABC-type multidrug transport system fused ATPase/permease subunit